MQGARRVVVVAVLVSLAALALSGCGGSGPHRSQRPRTASGPAPADSAWGKVLARVGADGTVDRTTALQAFALAFGPVPGVRVPDGPPGRVASGSEALRWALRFRDQVTPVQQRAIDRLAAAGAVVGGPGRGLPRGDGPGTAPYRTIVDELLARYRGPLGPLSIPTSIARVGADGTASAFADGYDANGAMEGQAVRCFIGVTPTGQHSSDDALTQVLAHELFHCYQHSWMPSLTRMYHDVEVAPWVIEGAATWAGINVAPVAPTPAYNWWVPYLTSPGAPLFSRTYDAVGFYGQVVQQGVDLWPLLRGFTIASGNLTRYHLLADPAGAAFLDAWGPGYLRRPARGPAWDITGKAVPAPGTLEPPVTDLTIANDDARTVSAAPFTVSLYPIDASADVVHVAIAGHARLADATGFDSTELTDLSVCTRAGGDCSCPDQSSGDGSDGLPASRQRVEGVLTLGLTGATDGARGTVTGQSLEEFCTKRRKQPPRPALTPCQVITPADAARLVPGLGDTTPHETIYNANGSGICAYADAANQLGIDAQIYHRPTGAPVDQDYSMLAAVCTEPVPGIGRRAGVAAAPTGWTGCVLAGTTIVTMVAIGATRDSMTATLRAIARRLSS